MLPFRHVFLV